MAAILPLILAAPLLWLAVPRTSAALQAARAGPALMLIQNGLHAERRDLETLVAGLRRSVRTWPSARVRADLGLGLLTLAERTTDADLISEAVAALRRSLTEAPARTFAWTRLAYGELLAGAAAETAAPLFEMSVITGPADPLLRWPRLDLGLHLWPELSEAGRRHVAAELILAWHEDAAMVVAMADLASRSALLDQVLGTDPSAAAALEILRALEGD